jgi:hypothetical protein
LDEVTLSLESGESVGNSLGGILLAEIVLLVARVALELETTSREEGVAGIEGEDEVLGNLSVLAEVNGEDVTSTLDIGQGDLTVGRDGKFEIAGGSSEAGSLGDSEKGEKGEDDLGHL